MGSGLIPGQDPADALPPLRERRWLLVGVGNDMRGDDAFGPLLARRLQEGGLPAIDAGMAPENTTGPILRAKPEVLILADATDLGAPVGTMRVLPPDALAEGGTSTHDPSLRLLLSYLQEHHPMEVWALVAQAGTRNLGASPSSEVEAAAERAARLLGGEREN